MSDFTLPWAQSFTGKEINLVIPDPASIDAQDIALGLSRINRFCGHTTSAYPWSVALHSLLAENLIPANEDAAMFRLAVLIHDAHEAYTGDITTPLKKALAYFHGGHHAEAALHALQAELDRAIYRAVGLPLELVDKADWQADIKVYDRLALAHEKHFFMAPEPKSWGELPEVPYYAQPPQTFPAASAENLFRTRLKSLIRASGVKPLSTFNWL